MGKYKMTKTELVGIQAVQDITECTLWTNHVANERTVPLIIIADPETGKTSLMKKYRKNRGVYQRRTLTAFRAIKDLLDGVVKIPRNKRVGHIIIFDLSDIFAYAPDVVDKMVQFLDAFIEECLSPQGAYWIATKDSEGLDGVRGGIIAGVNSFGFFTGGTGVVRASLFKGGFLSRCVIFSFNTSIAHVNRVFRSIREKRYHVGKGYVDKIRLDFPKKPVHMHISKTRLRDVESIARAVAVNLTQDVRDRSRVKKGEQAYEMKGFRMFKSFISLVKVSALRDGREKVRYNDVGRIAYLSTWMNLKMKNLIMPYPRDFTEVV